MSYQTHTDRKAVKEIAALDKTTVRRIRERIKELAENPYNSRISGPVRMGAGQRKSRVGDWRIIFTVDDAQQLVIILEIKHRKRIYPQQ
jgi:mRNA interferase RelE/StbE